MSDETSELQNLFNQINRLAKHGEYEEFEHGISELYKKASEVSAVIIPSVVNDLRKEAYGFKIEYLSARMDLKKALLNSISVIPPLIESFNSKNPPKPNPFLLDYLEVFKLGQDDSRLNSAKRYLKEGNFIECGKYLSELKEFEKSYVDDVIIPAGASEMAKTYLANKKVLNMG